MPQRSKRSKRSSRTASKRRYRGRKRVSRAGSPRRARRYRGDKDPVYPDFPDFPLLEKQKFRDVFMKSFRTLSEPPINMVPPENDQEFWQWALKTAGENRDKHSEPQPGYIYPVASTGDPPHRTVAFIIDPEKYNVGMIDTENDSTKFVEKYRYDLMPEELPTPQDAVEAQRERERRPSWSEA